MNTFIKWLVTIYVVSILAWSGMLRAEEVVLDHVAFNSNHFELTLGGRVNNTCGLSLKTRIIENQFTEEGPVAVIEVQNDEKVESCPFDQRDELFDMVVDVRSLGLKAGVTYNLTFANSFNEISNPIYTVEIPKNSFFPNYSPVHSSGMLTKTLMGQWILVRGMNDFIILKTKLDLSQYLGQYVTIEGTEVLHRTGPIFEVDEHNPLRAHNNTLEGPTMFLFSISTATY
jgi:hypothetical protein